MNRRNASGRGDNKGELDDVKIGKDVRLRSRALASSAGGRYGISFQHLKLIKFGRGEQLIASISDLQEAYPQRQKWSDQPRLSALEQVYGQIILNLVAPGDPPMFR